MKEEAALWFPAARREALRKARSEGDSDVLFLERATRERVGSEHPEDGCYGMEPQAVLAWLDGDDGAANRVITRWAEESASRPTSNLGEAGWALSGAVMSDFLCEQLLPETRAQAAGALWDLVRKLRRPTRGNPHTVTNNWWAVTHGGALCASLAALRLAGDSHPGADPDALPWSLGRLRAFCHHYGPAGLYHEGLGYIRYTSIFVLSAVQAARSAGQADLLEEFPNLRNLLSGLYVSTVPRPYEEDTAGRPEGFGSSLSWNDMGAGAGNTAVDQLGMAFAPEEQRPALKAWYDQLFGLRSQKPRLPGHHVGIPMAWAFLPLGLPAGDAADLPARVVDTRQGFFFWRDGYRGPDDMVFGVYSKATHAGGHSHEDAGSMRIDAFGVDWMCGPGQARPQRLGQSLFYPSEGAGPINRAYYNHFEQNADGFLLSMDMRKASQAYHERLISVRKSPCEGVELAMAMLDVADDHLKREWVWAWTFSRSLSPEIDPDGAGFRLLSAGGRILHVRFLETKPVSLELQQLPASQRTYAGGNTEHYDGKPLMCARFAPAPHVAVLVSAVWSAASPQEAVSGGVHELRLGGWKWERPFRAALPQGFRPGSSPGPSQNSLS